MITGFKSILFKFLAFAVVAILLFLLLLNTMLNKAAYRLSNLQCLLHQRERLDARQ